MIWWRLQFKQKIVRESNHFFFFLKLTLRPSRLKSHWNFTQFFRLWSGYWLCAWNIKINGRENKLDLALLKWRQQAFQFCREKRLRLIKKNPFIVPFSAEKWVFEWNFLWRKEMLIYCNENGFDENWENFAYLSLFLFIYFSKYGSVNPSKSCEK